MQYELHIGKMTDFISGEIKPKQIQIITESQFELIRTFANIKLDKDLNKIYIINDCEFTVNIHFDPSK